jgi:hypothetical protein
MICARLVEIDRRSGRRRVLAPAVPHARLLAADGAAIFIEREGAIEEATTPRRWKVTGRAIALTAADGKLYVATKEGPLWEIDRASGAARDLGLGGWWGTIALAAGGGKLYAVTQAGKLWEVDPAAHTKTILTMSGWESALSLALVR